MTRPNSAAKIIANGIQMPKKSATAQQNFLTALMRWEEEGDGGHLQPLEEQDGAGEPLQRGREEALQVLHQGARLRPRLDRARGPQVLRVIQSLEIQKVGLCCYDNKRFLLEDGIESLSYGHHKIGERKSQVMVS